MLGMMVHICNTTLGRLRQKGHEFEASLDYLGHLKITKKVDREFVVWSWSHVIHRRTGDRSGTES